jgi:hypothetical protein
MATQLKNRTKCFLGYAIETRSIPHEYKETMTFLSLNSVKCCFVCKTTKPS